MLGIWPIIMGVTMWFQMKLNPSPPDPTQKMIFDWMPLLFTFMLASFPAGLVIYWAWNNTLSVLQQSFIMKKHGAKIELFDNLQGSVREEERAEYAVILTAKTSPDTDVPARHDECRLHPRRNRGRAQAVRRRLGIPVGGGSLESLPPMKGHRDRLCRAAPMSASRA